MYAYRILVCSLLVISAAANDITIAEKDWAKLIETAITLCKCTVKPIEEISTASEDCKSNTTNAFLYMNALSKTPIDNVCENIRDINNKLKAGKLNGDILHTDNDTLVNHNDTHSNIKFPDDNIANRTDVDGREINGAEGFGPNRTHVGGNNGTEGLKPNCTNIDGETINGTDGLGPNCTHIDGVIDNDSEDSGPNRTHVGGNNETEGLKPNCTNIDGEIINGTNGLGPNCTHIDGVVVNGTENLEPNRTHVEGIINGSVNETDLYEGNTTEASLNNTGKIYNRTEPIEEMNVTESSTVGSNVTKPTIGPEGNSTSQRPVQTSETTATHSSPSPSTQEKKYELSTVIITFFCSFGAGILIAVGSKILYSRYRQRTYEIPSEQELH